MKNCNDELHSLRIANRKLEERIGMLESALQEREGASAALRESKVRESHIKQVLLAIRNVNQLIVSERDPYRLIERTCENLTETLGYYHAWIALLDDKGACVTEVAACGLNGGFVEMRARLNRGEFPACMRTAMEQDEVVVVEDPGIACPDCPIGGKYGDCAGLSQRLAFEGKVYGILSVSVPASYVHDGEEQSLFKEVAGDLAFALHKIEVEARREAAEREVASILESISDAFFALDDDMVVTYMNAAAAALLGRKIDDVVGRPLLEAFPEARGSIFETQYREAIRTRQPAHFETYFDVHPYRNWYEVRVYPREKGISVYFLVTTERKQAEEALRRANDIIAHSPAVAFVWGNAEEWPVHYVSENVGRLLGWVPGDFVSGLVPYASVVHPGDLARVMREVTESSADVTARTVCHTPYRIIARDGEIKWIEDLTTIQRAEDGSVLSYEGILLDISARKSAEEALQVSEARFRGVFESSPIGIAVVDPESQRFLRVNRSFLSIVGYAEVELYQLTVKDITHPEDWEREMALIRARLQGGAWDYKLEKRYLRKDGEIRWVRVNGDILNLEGRQLAVANVEDITERLQAAEALYASEESHRATLNAIGDAVIATDAAGRVTKMNPVAERLTDWSLKDAAGRPLAEVFHIVNARTREPVENPVAKVLATGRIMGLVNGTTLIARDGTKYLIADSAAPIQDDTGKAIGVVMVFRDVTAEHAAAEALRQSEERFSLAFRTSPYAITITRMEDGKFMEVNDAFASITGFSREEAIGDTSVGLNLWVNPEDRKRVVSELLEHGVMNGWELPFRRQNGETLTGLFSAQILYLNGERCILSSINDITERKRAENALRESEQRVRAKLDAVLSPEGDLGTLELADIIDTQSIQALMDDFFNLTHIGIGIIDLAGRVLVATGWQDICTKFHRVHPTMLRNCIESDTLLSTGVEPGTFKAYRCKNNMWDIVTPIVVGGKHLGNLFLGQFLYEGELPDLDVFRSQARKCGIDEDAYLAALNRVPRWSRETVEQVMHFYARFADLISTLSYSNLKLARTLDERERAETALRESEWRLKDAQKTARIGHVEFDVASRDIVWADTIYELYERDPLSGPPTYEEVMAFYVLEDARRLEECITYALEKAEPYRIDLRVVLPSGKTRYHHAIGTPVIGDDGRVVKIIGTVQDITERKQIETQLRQHERLVAVGQLAAGIAHDFRNLLTTIILYAQMIQRRSDLPPNVDQHLEIILSESNKAVNLVQQILDFSSRSMVKMQPLDLKSFIVEEVLTILKRTFPENIQLILSARGKVYTVKADPGRMRQALLNLALNGRDAMPKGGNLTFTLSEIQLKSKEDPPVADMGPGPWICLSVSDTGIGMTDEVYAHLFEPFFTTKEVGKGTGLGLAQVYGVVRQHEGYIHVETEMGVGTTFYLYFPALGAKAERADQGKSMSATPQGRGETILLVEDSDNLREAGRNILELLGYRVLTASNGREALEIYAAEPKHTIDLVITDMVMPEMGGEQLVKALLRTEPNLKALGITGYTMGEAMDGLQKAGFMDVINKPFEVETLAQVIRRTLDASPARWL